MKREEIINWLESQDYINELGQYIAVPSRSSNEEEVKECSLYAKSLMEKSGLQVNIYETQGNPVIIGQRISNPDNPTLLLYGHYDVQPIGDESLWDSPPFEIRVDNNKIYGRGTADNKGQHFAHFLGLRYLKEEHPNLLDQINIKFILDGDEERGSFSLPDFVRNNQDLLAADWIIVSDGPSLVYDRPSIVGSVRGILGLQIEIAYNKEDVHSGNFGGIARSSTRDLIDLISTMVDENGKSKIPGFYDDVIQPTEFELKQLNKLNDVYQQLVEKRGIDYAKTFDQFSNMYLNQFMPTFNINGIKAGGVNEMRRTIIPSKAIVSIDCRLVPAQDSERMKSLISTFIDDWAEQNNIRDNISYEFEHAMEPLDSSLKMDGIEQIISATKQGFNASPLLVPRLGGSLPIALFPKILDKPVILIPFALPDENNHAPNENLDIPYFKSGVATSVFIIKNIVENH